MLDTSELVTSTLRRFARHFATDDADVARLAERALLVLSNDPSLLDVPDIDEALLRVVHRVATEGY
jgi:hypothetical protein